MKPEAAVLCGCAPRTINNMMRRRIVPFYKVGRRVLFKQAEILKAFDDYKVDQALPAKWGQVNEKPWDDVEEFIAIIERLKLIEKRTKDEKFRRLAKEVLSFFSKFQR